MGGSWKFQSIDGLIKRIFSIEPEEAKMYYRTINRTKKFFMIKKIFGRIEFVLDSLSGPFKKNFLDLLGLI